jgi:hypothetical protein
VDRADNWTAAGLRHAIAFVQSRIRGDFEDTGLARVELHRDPSFAGLGSQGLSDRAEDVIVTCGGHRFISHLELGVEAACAHVANVLQDDVMDLLGRPWPHISMPTRAGGVLEPTMAGAGIAHWQLRGEPVCAVGHLRPLFERHELPWP